MRVHDQPFTAIDEHGPFVRRLTCTCCALAVRVERWEGRERGHRARFQLVSSHLEYFTGSEGQTYLAPSGQGRVTPRQVADSVASKAMQSQSLAALRYPRPAHKAAAQQYRRARLVAGSSDHEQGRFDTTGLLNQSASLSRACAGRSSVRQLWGRCWPAE